MERKTENDSRRRFFAILAAPSLVMHHTHTTPALERSYLRRIGLGKDEADDFLALLCETGRLDEGAQAVLSARGGDPAETARHMLQAHRRKEKQEE